MANRDIVAIGTSAGGVHALRGLAAALPAGFPAAILVVLHLPAESRSALDEILSAAGPLPAQFAKPQDAPEPGRIFIAPPGVHLLMSGDARLTLGTGPRENNSRPSIDALMRSIAVCCAPRAVGVILTGTLGDGASGLQVLKQCGGIAVVQNPQDAAFPAMPEAALESVAPDHIVALSALPTLLTELVELPRGPALPVPEELKYDVAIALSGSVAAGVLDRIGTRSTLTCPHCHGVLWEIGKGGATRYRCHTGHAYSAASLRRAIDEDVLRGLASAVRALEERAMLVRKMRDAALAGSRFKTADHWSRQVQELDSEIEKIRQAIRKVDAAAPDG